MATFHSQKLARKLLPKLACSAQLAILLGTSVLISGAYSHSRTDSYDNLGPGNLRNRPSATRRNNRNVTMSPPRQSNNTMARQPITRTNLETIQKGNEILQLQLEQALAKIEQNIQEYKNLTEQSSRSPRAVKTIQALEAAIAIFGQKSQTQDMRYPNTPLETKAGDTLQLNIQYPSRICSSMMSRLNTSKTKFWGTRSQKWSDKIFIWHSKPPVHTRHPPRNSRKTPSWAWSQRPWPPTCFSNTATSRSRTTTWIRRTSHHGGNHFSKRRSESEIKGNQKSESQKRYIKRYVKGVNKRNQKGESLKRNIKGENKKGQQVKQRTMN